MDKATETLAAAGVTTPVVLNLQYVAERYGPSWGDAYGLVKDQLESSGLFTVNIQATEWVQYRETAWLTCTRRISSDGSPTTPMRTTI